MADELSWADQQRAGELVGRLHEHLKEPAPSPADDGEGHRRWWATYREIEAEVLAIIPPEITPNPNLT